MWNKHEKTSEGMLKEKKYICCILCNATCLHGSWFKKHIISISCLLLLLLYAPAFLKRIAFYKAHRSEKRGPLWLARVVIGRILQAWDGSVTSLTVLWWPFLTKTIKLIRNEAFVASSGDIITDNNDLYCLFSRCVASRRVKITMSAFVIGQTTNNKHYFRQLKLAFE